MITWDLHPTLTNDHFGIILHLTVATIPPSRPFPPCYNTRLADWTKFRHDAEVAFTTFEPPNHLDDREHYVTHTILQAAQSSIPLT